MSEAFSKLFEPVNIGQVTLKNRIAMAPMETIGMINPDEVFVATGSNSIKPDVPGIERSNVVTAMDLLLGREKAGDSAVVIGGGLIGCETALWLAKQGRKVTIVEMLPE